MNSEHKQAPHAASTTAGEHLACPFCAMGCDDLSLRVHNDPGSLDPRGCSRAGAAFSLALDHPSRAPTVQGREVDWPKAIAHARRLLGSARLPLFHGLLGDLNDCQGALRMAERYGGVVDHADGDAMAINLAVYQDSGWVNTSLGEVRNRADLVVLIGDGIDDRLPRLRERVFDVGERLHGAVPAEVITLDTDPLDTLDQVRAILHGRPLPAPSPVAADLHTRLAGSRYPVIVPPVAGRPDAGLLMQSSAELVRLLNEQGRAALLVLSPGIGSATAQHASAWHGGFGIRTSFAAGYPEQDLRRNAGGRLLAEGQADLLVWISTLDATPAPVCSQSRIVIGHPAMQFDGSDPDVFLPASVPGVHRRGFIHRGDGLHMVPLQALVHSDLPHMRDLVDQLLDAPPEAD